MRLHRHIEARHRFVGDDDPRLAGQRARHRHAPNLAAREFGRHLALHVARQAHQGQQFGHVGPFTQAVQAHGFGQAEPVRLHGLRERAEIPGRVAELLALVGLPGDVQGKVPSELSGGQVRRVAVARALACEPRVIVADESVAGLDVSVQAQLLNLLRDLQRTQGLALVFVTHDLGVAAYLCKRVAVMYLGRIVEMGRTRDVLARPLHPYTQGLMRAFPRFDAPLRVSLPGEIPSAANLPAGCRFRSRCDRTQPDCALEDPAQRAVGPDRYLACLHPLDEAAPAQ